MDHRYIWSVDIHTTNEIDAELKGMFSTHEGECTIISADTDVKNVAYESQQCWQIQTYVAGGGTNYVEHSDGYVRT